jgi:hypothetical protein
MGGRPPQTPRDAEFWDRVAEVVELYTRRLRADAMVSSLVGKTTRPPLSGGARVSAGGGAASLRRL